MYPQTPGNVDWDIRHSLGTPSPRQICASPLGSSGIAIGWSELHRGRAIMTLKTWTVAGALVSLAPCVSHAATDANFAARTTGDLVELCAATPDSAVGTAAVNFCDGYAQGAVSVEMQNLAAFRGAKL